MKVCAVIPAGGQGTRMGGVVPKQFRALRGKPILHYTLKTLEDSELIDSLVLVVPAVRQEQEVTTVQAPAAAVAQPVVVTQVAAAAAAAVF